MQADTQRWSLFGLDLAPWIQQWRAGWRELLWGRVAGIRHRLEAPVALYQADAPSVQWYQAETRLVGQPATRSHHQAWLLPAESVLLRELELPAALEADLPDAVALEAEASSPFVPEDTCYGWTLLERRDGSLRVGLAITAISEVMAFLHARGIEATGADELPEVWCLGAEERPIVLQGFGEHRRGGDYRRRLTWMAALGVASLLLVFALLAVPGVARQMQADNMDHHYAQAVDAADEAIRLREQLALDNERALALQAMIDQRQNYHELLDRLTAQTPDSVHFEQLTLQGQQIRVRGWASNAAAYMQSLTEDSGYAEVKSPSGIRRHGRTNLEQFVLELQLTEVLP